MIMPSKLANRGEIMLKIGIARKEAGITQLELSKILNISRSTISMWESGASNPTVEMLPELAKALHCTIDELFPQKKGGNP